MSERQHGTDDEALPFRFGVFDPFDEDCPPRLFGPVLPASRRGWAFDRVRAANKLDCGATCCLGLFTVQRGNRLAIHFHDQEGRCDG